VRFTHPTIWNEGHAKKERATAEKMLDAERGGVRIDFSVPEDSQTT
jgi:hypothetical protein